jgi:hypothetical protein
MEGELIMNSTGITITTIAGLCGLIALGMWGCPKYNVYNQEMKGKSLLAHAQSSKEVAVATSKAKMESATYEAAVDTLRAHGVARANEIIGNSLKNNEAYLRYLWIDEISKTQNQIIYFPTEANLPILESSRLKK